MNQIEHATALVIQHWNLGALRHSILLSPLTRSTLIHSIIFHSSIPVLTTP